VKTLKDNNMLEYQHERVEDSNTIGGWEIGKIERCVKNCQGCEEENSSLRKTFDNCMTNEIRQEGDHLTFIRITRGQWNKLFKRIEKLERLVLPPRYLPLKCDYCERKGKFQCGVNKNKKIGTWCSDKCFTNYTRDNNTL
jgi:hypothetical protein